MALGRTAPGPGGVRLDQSLSDARALAPDLDCHPADDAGDRALLLTIAAWCERLHAARGAGYGARARPWPVHGRHRLQPILLGGEATLVADLEARLGAQGFHVRLCLADTPGRGLGHGALRPGPDHSRGRAARGCAARLSLSGLRLEPALVASLGRVGLKTIGCIAALPARAVSPPVSGRG